MKFIFKIISLDFRIDILLQYAFGRPEYPFEELGQIVTL